MFERILVANDASESSRAIFNRALTLAKALHSRLNILNVIVPFEDFYPKDTFIGISAPLLETHLNQLQELERSNLKMLRILAQEAIAAGVEAEFAQKIGDSGKSICEVAQEWDANLIIVGRRGFCGLSEMLIGSTSNYVLHHAPCSVLTIQCGDLDTDVVGIASTERELSKPPIER